MRPIAIPMRRATTLAGALALLIASAGPAPAGTSGPDRPARLLVKARSGASGAQIDGAVSRAAGGRARTGWNSRFTRWREIVLQEGQDPAGVLAALRVDPSIEAVEPERFARITVLPDDLDKDQWWVDNNGQTVAGQPGVYDADIDAPEAWNLTRGSRGITIAVLDTGVHMDHPDLTGNLLHGYDFYNNDSNPWDDAGPGHGTPVAGVIGAVGNNGEGMAGLNWTAGLLPVKVCGANGVCPYAAIAAGVEYAVSRGARVINLSMTCDEHQDPVTGACTASRPGACYSAALAEAIGAASQAGVMVVTAAGNCGADLSGPARAYPCAYDLPNVLCVAATDSRDEMATFSNHGSSMVRLAAPGSSVLSLSTSSSDRLLWDGTSFATPMVAGAAALVLSRNHTLTPPALAARLMTGGDPLPALHGMVKGAMRLNALGAVKDLFLEPLTASGSTGGSVSLVADFDGDGLADALESSPGSGCRVALSDGVILGDFNLWSSAPLPATALAADFDGDGRADIARAVAGGVEVLRSTGERFETPRRWSSLPWRPLTAAADVDGDGRADLIRYRERRGFLVTTSSGSSFRQPVLWSAVRPGHRQIFADVDGDGRADLVRERSGRLLVSLAQAGRFGTPSLWGAAGVSGQGALLAGDVDGDGRSDVAIPAGGCWHVMIAGEGSFGASRPWACDPPGSRAALAGFDADARADLVRVSPSQGWEYLGSSE